MAIEWTSLWFIAGTSSDVSCVGIIAVGVERAMYHRVWPEVKLWRPARFLSPLTLFLSLVIICAWLCEIQGLDKQETVDKYGKDQVLVWRRSYDVPPPVVDPSSEHHPSNDPRYAGFEFDNEFTESLATTLDRVLPYYEKEIVPQLKDGKTVMVAAHGNSLRALVKHLDGIDEATISELNIPTGTPLVYELDDDLKPIPQEGAIAPLQGRYLGDQDAIRARIEGVKNQTK